MVSTHCFTYDVYIETKKPLLRRKTLERCREEKEKSILKIFKEIIQYLLLLPLVWLHSWAFSLFNKKKIDLKKINCPRPQTKQMNEMKNKEQKENKPTEETRTCTSLAHIRKVKENWTLASTIRQRKMLKWQKKVKWQSKS